MQTFGAGASDWSLCAACWRWVADVCVCTHRRAALDILNKLDLAGRAIEQTAAVELSLQVLLSLVVQHLPRGVQQGLLQGEPDSSDRWKAGQEFTSKKVRAHLLPTVHCQARAGDAELEEEDYEEDDHVLQVNRSRRQTRHE